YIRRNFPNAPTPAVFRSEGLLSNAEQLRETMGDEKFFGKLNEVAKGSWGGGAGWGNISATWTLTSYNEALKAPPNSEKCRPRTRSSGNAFSRDAEHGGVCRS